MAPESAKSKKKLPPPPEQPKEFIKFCAELNQKKKIQAYDQLLGPKEFLPNMANLATIINQCRTQVLIGDKKLVKVDQQRPNDHLYLPASYTTYDHRDYMFFQAPKSEETAVDLWRSVWQDDVCIIASVSQKTDFGKEASSRCYPYWPKKDGETLALAGGRYTIKCTKKITEGLEPTRQKIQRGHIVYELTVTSVDKSFKDDEKKEEESAEIVTKEVTLLNYENWPFDKWPEKDDIIYFIADIVKAEKDAVKKAQNGYIPPVMLQGFEALGRTCIIWVVLAVARLIEKKEPFDPLVIINKLAKQRPGALGSRLHYIFAYALTFRVGGYFGTITDWKKCYTELKDGYEKNARQLPDLPL